MVDHQEREQQIALLEAVGINVVRITGRINYSEAILEGSEVFREVASFVQGLMEKYVSLRALVGHGFRTPENAETEYISQLRQARDDAKRWRAKAHGNRDIVYVTETLEERLTEVLDRSGADRPIRL